MCWADVLAVFSDTASQTCSSIASTKGGANRMNESTGSEEARTRLGSELLIYER